MVLSIKSAEADDLARELASVTGESLVEATIVAEARLGPSGGLLVQRVIREARIAVVDVTSEVALDAIEGWRAFGRGRNRAALDLGDCFTYALALRGNAAVLCTGNDFSRTDVAVHQPAR